MGYERDFVKAMRFVEMASQQVRNISNLSLSSLRALSQLIYNHPDIWC
jgi:hypothetical protein